MIGEIPVYGAGTTNRIIPWFTATKAPYNYALPQYLGDRLTWETWGGENQPVTFPMGRSNLQYSLAQDYNNPNHIRQWNPMLIGYKLGSDNTTNPLAVFQGNMNAYNWGASLMNQQIAMSKIPAIAQALGSLEGQLTKTLQSDKLTDAQRQKLEDALKKVQAKKAEIQEKLQNQASVEDLEAIQGEVIELQNEVSKVVDEIINEIQGDAPANNDKDNNTTVSEDAAKKFEEKQNADLTTSLDICKDIYAGSIGHSWGTDYDTIRKGTAKINKDNAAMVVLAWDQQYKPNCQKSLVKTLFDEEHFWNPSLGARDKNNKVDNANAKNIDMIWNIVASMEEQAKELGIYNQLAGQFTVAYDELDDTFVDQEAIENAVETIAKAVYEKQIETGAVKIQKDIDKTAKADADKKAKADKAEEDKKALKAEQEAWETFRGDMQEIFKDENAQVSNKVQYKDGKFTIRIEGRNYEGKDFVELAQNIKKAGYEPKEYLIEKVLDVAS